MKVSLDVAISSALHQRSSRKMSRSCGSIGKARADSTVLMRLNRKAASLSISFRDRERPRYPCLPQW